ncbi:MAG: site-2 protease family protein [Kiritimatiellae bacterium]|nr:site-2 protease family protein [Kiritimatiellia bacterium]
MEFLITVLAIIACILLFSFAIFIHEFGHFLAAKLLGFRVDTFSIGFGPALWKKTWKGVEYRISAILFGGYVALPQLDPAGTAGVQGSQTEGEVESDNAGRARSPSAPPDGDADTPCPTMANWKKIVVAFAGPFGNIVLAVVLACVLSAVPYARFGKLSAEIGEVVKGGPAEKGGMQAGDRVLSVNGNAVQTWSDMLTEVQIAGDKRAAEFVVDRGGTNVVLSITPTRDEVTGGSFIMALSTTNDVRYAAWMPDRSPWQQLAWDAGSMGRVLKALVTPKESKATARSLGGPVMIAEGLYYQVRNDGWDALGFLRFLNVNLAVLNLLPIPVLDGGLILFSLIALIFRRPVPRKIVDGLSMVFMYLFLALMITLVWRDVARSRRMHKARGDKEKIFKLEEQRRIRAEKFKPAFNLGTPDGRAGTPCPPPEKD